ncbi:MAG: aspartate aminotransferase family protein [Anaerolineae bacterium]
MSQTIIDLEGRYLVQTYKRAPFVLERGEGMWLYDTEGHRYLDFLSGIAVNALGYGDPQILAAIEDQANRLLHVSNLYHTLPHVELARLLVEHSFADRVFFCNSGTEAVEGALKFARKWAVNGFGAEKHEIVAFTGSFHGRTMGALSITSKEKYRQPFEPLVPGVRFTPFNDLEAAAEAIRDEVCAVIVEPLQGEGGVNVAEKGFLQELRDLCDQHQALLIFDEVQCGLGRTGTLWAHEYYDVTPDLMTLAKPLGGGLPIGAVLATEEVARVLEPGDHGSTFAANPLICRVAQVVFNRIKESAFLESVRAKGEYLRGELEDLQAESGLITQVRGRGLMWGLELTVEADQVVQRGYREGIIVGTAGERILRLLPPLIVEREHIDLVVEKLAKVFRELEAHDDQESASR